MLTSLKKPNLGWIIFTAISAMAGLVACGTEGINPAHDHVSDNPFGGPGNFTGGEDGGGSSSSSSGGAVPSPSDPERLISEADIIQINDNKVYALSRYSGLSIINVTQQDELTLLGHYESAAEPFEMYLKGTVVYALYNSWGREVFDAETNMWSWVQSSRIEALDVSNPGNIQVIGSFDLPGRISDTRIVGDVLYAVTFEDGFCWGCQSARTTTVTSLNVANPSSIGIVDQLFYNDNDPWGYGWQRSVSATTDRLYIAGIEWDGQSMGHSTIQVVDISDPGGQLVEGAAIEAKGQIESRWQMEEHEGVLRVISQPGVWENGYPTVQTFTVNSSQSIVPLGSLDLTLPMPERLRSVRFDGARAFAVTAVQTDPLFTIDLSNPALPAQMGEVEIPGWIYHIEPRGDRLYTVGFDNQNPQGSLHVSLFNVADLAQPSLIERVAFGGDWSQLGEDQDRIHKSFRLFDDIGLIAVPYSGFHYTSLVDYCGSYVSGIQLIDFTADDLAKRGVVPSRGQARRAFMHNERLFSVSDNEVSSYNIADRDNPVETAELPIAMHTTRTVKAGNLIVRLSADWWTSEPRLEIVPANQADSLVPLGVINLGQLVPNSMNGCMYNSFWGSKLFAHGNSVYLVAPSDYNWNQSLIAVIDISDPANPKVQSTTTINTSIYGYGYYGVIEAGDMVVQLGSTLVFQGLDDPYQNSSQIVHGAWLNVVDLQNPAAPKSTVFQLPSGFGHTALQKEGSDVLTSHWAPVQNNPNKVRFYFDRIDVSNPAAPALVSSVNVPGSFVSFDTASNHLLTVDYSRESHIVANPQVCYESFGNNAEFVPNTPDVYDGPGTCSILHRTFKASAINGNSADVLDSLAIDDEAYISNVLVGDDRVFASQENWGGWVTDGPSQWSHQLMALGGLRAGSLDASFVLEQETQHAYPVLAFGKHLVAQSWSPSALWLLDSTDLHDPVFEKKADLRSYVYDISLSGDDALCSLGPYGMQVVNLSE